MYDIRHEVDTPVANHFNLPGHSLEENFQIIPIEQTPILHLKTETDLLRFEPRGFLDSYIWNLVNLWKETK